jgi:hypothetical protein
MRLCTIPAVAVSKGSSSSSSSSSSSRQQQQESEAVNSCSSGGGGGSGEGEAQLGCCCCQFSRCEPRGGALVCLPHAAIHSPLAIARQRHPALRLDAARVDAAVVLQ